MKIFHPAATWLICSGLGCVSVCAQTAPAAAPAATGQTQQAPAPPDPDAAKTQALSALSDALALVTAAEKGDRSQDGTLAAMVSTLRADPDVPEYDRYVLVARATALNMPPTGKDRKAKFAAYADLARTLYKEFPQQSEPYLSLLALAEDSPDTASAAVLAQELLDSKAPDAIKTSAGRLLDREAMVGTPVDFSATDSNGNPLTLSQFRGNVVVLYVWTGRASGAANWVQKFLAQGNSQVVFVGLNFDSDQAAAQAQMAQVAPGSIQVYDSSGLDGSLAAALHLTRCPSVYLLDRNGVLQDVHGIELFNDKLTKLLGVTHS